MFEAIIAIVGVLVTIAGLWMAWKAHRRKEMRLVENYYTTIADSCDDNGIGAFLKAGVALLESDKEIREVVKRLERRIHRPIQPGVREKVMDCRDLRRFFELAAEHWSGESLRDVQAFVDDVLSKL